MLSHDQRSLDDGGGGSTTRSSVSRMTPYADESSTSIRKVMAVVERFFDKCTVMHMDTNTKQLHAKKISHYLVQVISNYDVQNIDEVTRCVAENLKTFLPKRALRYIQTRDLAQLFSDVLHLYEDVAERDDQFTIDELMENILSELKIKVPKNMINYSETFVCEFLEDVFAVLPLEEVNKAHRIKGMANALRKAVDLDRTGVDATKIAAEVSAYFGNSLGNNINTQDLNRFIDDLISNLSSGCSDQSKKANSNKY